MIVFVRHGETAPNRRGAALGRADVPLTDLGRRQAAAVADALVAASEGAGPETGPAPPGPVRVVSSPLRRARDTAELIAKRLGAPVEVDDRLIELDYGAWDTRDWDHLPVDALARWRSDPTFAPPGGESLVAVASRVASFCGAHLAARAAELVVAVSHVSPIKAAATWALGVDVGLAWRMRLGVASITRVAVGPTGPVLLSFNETGHLSGVVGVTGHQ